MAINPTTPGIHHICLRSMDFDKTKKFYQNILGFPLAIDTPDLIIFAAAGLYLAFKKADPKNKEYTLFTPFEVGLDHIAITCETEEELHRFAKELGDAGVENTGVKLDPALNKLYVAFKDPDRIQWEFYMK
jgi:catechol 2,3-dioxygenase-like lactoylglutathione lyase family enzyme